MRVGKKRIRSFPHAASFSFFSRSTNLILYPSFKYASSFSMPNIFFFSLFSLPSSCSMNRYLNSYTYVIQLNPFVHFFLCGRTHLLCYHFLLDQVISTLPFRNYRLSESLSYAPSTLNKVWVRSVVKEDQSILEVTWSQAERKWMAKCTVPF